MALITAAQSGDSNVGANFVGGIAPVNGDVIDAATFTINVVADITLGDGTETDACIGDVRVNTGVTLTLNGHMSLGASVPNHQSGSIIELNPGAGQTFNIVLASAHNKGVCITTDGDSSTGLIIRKAAGAAGTAVFEDNALLNAYLGSNIRVEDFGGATTDAFHPRITQAMAESNITFTRCGRVYVYYTGNNNGSLDCDNWRVMDSIATNQPYTLQEFSNAGARTNTMNFTNFVCDSVVRGQLLMLNHWNLSGMRVGTAPLTTASANGEWQDLNNLFIGDGTDFRFCGNLSNTYIQSNVANPHGLISSGQQTNRTVDKYVFEGLNTSPTQSGDAFLWDAPIVAGLTFTITNHVNLPNSLSGNIGSTSLTFNQAPDYNGLQIFYENSVTNIPTANRAIAISEASDTPSGTIQRIRDSIFYADTASSGFVLEALTADQTDVLVPSGFLNNAVYQADTTGSNGFINAALSAGVPAGTVVDAPNFIDATRNLANWGVTQGTGGTIQEAKDLIFAAADGSIVTNLIDWVSQGFIPQAASYQSASSSGGVLGTNAVAPVTLSMGTAVADNPTITLSGGTSLDTVASSTVDGIAAIYNSTSANDATITFANLPAIGAPAQSYPLLGSPVPVSVSDGTNTDDQNLTLPLAPNFSLVPVSAANLDPAVSIAPFFNDETHFYYDTTQGVTVNADGTLVGTQNGFNVYAYDNVNKQIIGQSFDVVNNLVNPSDLIDIEVSTAGTPPASATHAMANNPAIDPVYTAPNASTTTVFVAGTYNCIFYGYTDTDQNSNMLIGSATVDASGNITDVVGSMRGDITVPTDLALIIHFDNTGDPANNFTGIFYGYSMAAV